MCNLYIMYWVEGGLDPLRYKPCFSAGPPLFYWSRYVIHGRPFTNIPEDASFLPPEVVEDHSKQRRRR